MRPEQAVERGDKERVAPRNIGRGKPAAAGERQRKIVIVIDAEPPERMWGANEHEDQPERDRDERRRRNKAMWIGREIDNVNPSCAGLYLCAPVIARPAIEER